MSDEPMSQSVRTESQLVNIRDLGGTPVAQGSVRNGLLFRSDDLSLSPRNEIIELTDQGVRLVLDLRSPTEKEQRPHRHLNNLDVEYRPLSFIADAIDPQTAAARMTEIVTASDLGQWYAKMAEDAAGVIVHGLELVANTNGGAIFHCAAGKDRTGVFAAAVLTVLGADVDTIVADYALTDQRMGLVLARLAIAFQEEQGQSTPQWSLEMFDSDSPLLRAHADAARTMLSELEERHGGMLRLLKTAGLSLATEERLRERLT